MDGLVPDWDAVKSVLLEESATALFMVHYFGQPQDVEYYQAFCDKHDLRLIEDNAHGHGGRFHGQPLGTFGNIGISSPRKILDLASGGVLYCRCEYVEKIKRVKEFRPYPGGHFLHKLKTGLNHFPRIKGRLRGLNNISKNWSDPLSFHENEKPDYKIDPGSRQCIVSADWQSIAVRRRAAWSAWDTFARDKGLTPVFSKVHPRYPCTRWHLSSRDELMARCNLIVPHPKIPILSPQRNGESRREIELRVYHPLQRRTHMVLS